MPLDTGEQSLAVVEADGSIKRHGTVAFQPMLVEGEQADTVEATDSP